MGGGHTEFIVYGSKSDPIKVKINYGPSEIKIETVGNGSLILGKLYIAISSKDKAMEMIELWNRIYERIKGE